MAVMICRHPAEVIQPLRPIDAGAECNHPAGLSGQSSCRLYSSFALGFRDPDGAALL